MAGNGANSRFDSYLSSNAMRAMANSLSLASTVLRFQIVELWHENPDQNGFNCTYVHASEEVVKQYPELIVGYYPNHKRPHIISPMVRQKTVKSFFSFSALYLSLFPPYYVFPALCRVQKISRSLLLEIRLS